MNLFTIQMGTICFRSNQCISLEQRCSPSHMW